MAASSARQSQFVTADLTQSDGDTWQERIAVCESATLDGKPKLLMRSYYRNQRTDERNWDEPPSGASQIKHATSEMRQKAELQMKELQLTLEMIPDDPDVQADAKIEKKKKSGGLFGRLRGNKKEKKYLPESKDLNLQKAIARSMSEQNGLGSANEPVVYYDPEASEPDLDGALALAKALSMTELTEDEMLQQAIEASRLESENSGVAGAASVPKPVLLYDPFEVTDESNSEYHDEVLQQAIEASRLEAEGKEVAGAAPGFFYDPFMVTDVSNSSLDSDMDKKPPARAGN
jgi:hypothetical protein